MYFHGALTVQSPHRSATDVFVYSAMVATACCNYIMGKRLIQHSPCPQFMASSDMSRLPNDLDADVHDWQH